MVNCPVCDAVLELDEEELDEGDPVDCSECGAELLVTGKDPLELQPADDVEDEDDEEFDFDEEDDEESLDEEDDDEEEEDWK